MTFTAQDISSFLSDLDAGEAGSHPTQAETSPPPASRTDATPSPDATPPATAAKPKAERAAVAEDTGAAAATQAESTAPAEDATPKRAAGTPKWWQGTQEEWDAFRAEQNRTANAERDRANREAAARQELTERLAFLESQLVVRDASYADIVARAYGDEERARQLLDADRQRGNDAYLRAKEARDREAAQAQAQAQAAARQATTHEAEAEAVRKQLFADNLVVANEYADGKGVVGLKARDTLIAEFSKPENARLLRISQSGSVSDEDAAAATEELYERAHKSWQALVDAAATAKQEVQRGEDATAAGRKTALGAPSAATGDTSEWTPEAADRELAEYFKEQDRKAGGHYRLSRDERMAIR